MDVFLKNLHQRTEAIPGTPTAKRLKVRLSISNSKNGTKKGQTTWTVKLECCFEFLCPLLSTSH